MKKLLLALTFLTLGFATKAQFIGSTYKTDSVVQIDVKGHRQPLTDSFTVYFDKALSLVITNLVNHKVWHVYCTENKYDDNTTVNGKSFNALAFQCTVNDDKMFILTLLVDNATGTASSIGLLQPTTDQLLAFFLNPNYTKVNVTKETGKVD